MLIHRAAMADPRTLRSLDAVHLATALLVAIIEAFVVYDDRLADAARAAGMTVLRRARLAWRLMPEIALSLVRHW
jgi:predicted nucleic acid-binding protein